MQTATSQLTALTLTFHADPGHGWAAVPHSLLWELGIASDISPYSYVDESYAYLEEDCDFSVLMRALESKGFVLKLNEKHSENDSYIRAKASFNPDHYPQPIDYVDVTVHCVFIVNDAQGVQREVQDTFNWKLAPDNCRGDLAEKLQQEIERQREHGWLRDKTLVSSSVMTITRNLPDGRFLGFPVLVES